MVEVNETIQKIAEELLEQVGVEGAKAEVSDVDDSFRVRLESTGDEGILIGFHGENLNALQQILTLLVYRATGELQALLVDVGDYRQERRDRLEELAGNVAKRVRFLQDPVTLPPMNPYERRLVHLTIQEIPGVFSESTGDGRERRVVIKAGEK